MDTGDTIEIVKLEFVVTSKDQRGFVWGEIRGLTKNGRTVFLPGLASTSAE
jgi:hypothetical protein